MSAVSNEARVPLTDDERSRGVGELVRDAWSQAVVAVNTAEEEVQRFLGRVSDLVEVGPDEARRLANELTERLRTERSELEDRVEAGVRRTLGALRLPSLDDVSHLDARLDRIEERLERLLSKRQG